MSYLSSLGENKAKEARESACSRDFTERRLLVTATSPDQRTGEDDSSAKTVRWWLNWRCVSRGDSTREKGRLNTTAAACRDIGGENGSTFAPAGAAQRILRLCNEGRWLRGGAANDDHDTKPCFPCVLYAGVREIALTHLVSWLHVM